MSRLTVRQIAEHFGVGDRVVYRWVEDNIIPHIRLPGGTRSPIRFDPKKIEEWEKKFSFEVRK